MGAYGLEHADFLDDAHGRRYDWRVMNWSEAVRLVLGRRGLWGYRCAFAALLAPTASLAVFSLASNRLVLLVFVFLSFWGFRASSPGPTGVGAAASLLVALVGGALAWIRRDELLFFAALLPGVTWLGSCAILGATASYLRDAIRASETSFQLLVRRGVLIATPVADSTHSREPPGSTPNSASSPPAS